MDDVGTRSRSTSTGAAAVALAGVGLAGMAIVGAAPGSPFQPALTPNGQPKGLLKDIALRFGLGSIHGNVQLFVATTVSVLAVAAFLFLLREAFRGGVSLRLVAGLVVFVHVALLFVPLLFSRDVYSYAYYGRIAGVYGGNPYVETPLDHSGDLLWGYVGPKWVDTPAVYGPAWTSLSAGLSRFLPKPVDHVEAYRFLAIVASLATCAALVWVMRMRWPGRAAFALVAFGANPVVLFHSIASGHNDLLLALAVVVALGLVLRDRPLPAVAVLTLGALVKASAVIPLVLLIVWYVGGRPSGERRRALATSAGLAGGLAFAFSLPYLQLQDPTLGMLTLAGHEGWLAPSMALNHLLDFVSFHTLGWVARVGFAGLLLVSLIGIGREVWRRAPDRSVGALAAAWGWSLLLLALLGPVLLPWYVVWALPLAWALPRLPRLALLGVGAVLAVTLWSAEPLRYPGAFGVNLFVGHWVVTPALLVVLVLLLRELRSRLRLGFGLQDEALTDEIVAVPQVAEPLERIPAPARQA
jgi:alpha-1,6-mannosyltransferase